MKSIVSCLLLILFANISEAQKVSVPDSVFEYYQVQNEREIRLADFKDSDLDLRLKIMQVYVINKSRKNHNANPVQLDVLASRVANKMCKEATEMEYVGHWNVAGEKPYHRYAFAGGVDHVSENAYGMWTTEIIGSDSASISKNMRDGHKEFMSEIYPNNGHKKNCIDKGHNYVGLGFFNNEHRFSYYEEFVDRYYKFENVPTQPLAKKAHHTITIICAPSIEITTAFACKELPIQKMTPKAIDRRDSYLDGTNSSVSIPIPSPNLDKNNNKRYEFDLSFKQKGLYYLQIFHKKEVKGKLTGDEIPGSGICIWVE